jgi:hypothetical protein
MEISEHTSVLLQAVNRTIKPFGICLIDKEFFLRNSRHTRGNRVLGSILIFLALFTMNCSRIVMEGMTDAQQLQRNGAMKGRRVICPPSELCLLEKDNSSLKV